MENQENKPEPVSNESVISVEAINFHGNGKDLFGIMIVNVLLSIITLGIYYPWAKASYLRYTYSETEFKGSRFSFHGTGMEMFKGMAKAVLILGLVIGFFYLSIFLEIPFLGAAVYGLSMIFILPLAIVGSLKYRTSRSSWRGIHFGYRGTYNDMLKVNAIGMTFSFLTFGIYTPWYTMDLYKEIIGNIRLGSLKFKFNGSGAEYFGELIVGFLLTLVTLGLYSFKWSSNIHNFLVNNIRLEQEGVPLLKGRVIANTTGWGIFKLNIINALILIFSLGIAAPWIIVRTLNYFTSTMSIKGTIDFDQIAQTENVEASAVGEGFADGLDLQII